MSRKEKTWWLFGYGVRMGSWRSKEVKEYDEKIVGDGGGAFCGSDGWSCD